MHIKDIIIAIGVAILWGFNFVVMKVGIIEIPPILFVATRSLFAIFPLIFFIPKPPVSWNLIIGIGFFLGILTFLFILLGLHLGISGTLTCLVVQSQAFFTVIFAVLFLGERFKFYQILGMIISFLGILVIGLDQFWMGSLLGICCVLIGAASWGFSNILIKKAGNPNINMFDLIIWASLIPPIPLILYAIYMDGIPEILYVFSNAGILSYGTLIYSGLISGVLGYALWGYLLKKYTTGSVASFSMLVPVFATCFSVPIFNETFTNYMILGGAFVAVGLMVNQFLKN